MQFLKERGLFFTLGVVPLHFVRQLCSGVGFTLASEIISARDGHCSASRLARTLWDGTAGTPQPARTKVPALYVASSS
jgi:hypothetical protein